MSDPDVPATDREADELLAIELSLGLLEPDARAEAERRVSEEPAFAALYSTWRARALALLQGWEDRPPEQVWSSIVRRLPANDVERALRWWQAATGVATSVALVLGTVLLQEDRPTPPRPDRPTPVERPVQARTLVAVLASPDRSDVVAVSYDPATRHVFALPQRLATDGREAELWVIPAGGAPVPAGLLMPVSRTELVPQPGVAALMVPGATLAISLEPRGGSRTGAPTGPVILTGKVAQT